MKLIINIISLLCFYIHACVLVAQEYDVQKELSEVTFLATGTPGFLRINGKGAFADGKAHYDPKSNELTADIWVDLSEFTTEMGMRDRHMKDKYLDVKHFPKAELKIENFHHKLSESKQSEISSLPAKLTLHGVTKDIQIKAFLDYSKENAVKIKSTFMILLNDFNIQIPSFAGVTVAKDVEVQVNLTAKRI